MRKGLVFNIQKFSVHDGPGIRTTVFLKGCPLCCSWCHNPEGISPQPEPAVMENRCIHCGTCHDLATDGERVEACPTGARQIVGREMSVAGVMAEILADKVFYDESGDVLRRRTARATRLRAGVAGRMFLAWCWHGD
jgi:pyruvate formate lyase activating enzyme